VRFPYGLFRRRFSTVGACLFFGENGGAICTYLAQNGFAEVEPAGIDGLLYEVVSDSGNVDRFYLLVSTGDVIVGGTRERINEIAELAPLTP